MDLARVGATMRRVREARAHDEATAARGADISEVALHQFEAGAGRLSTAALARLADFLQVDVDQVIDGGWKPAVTFRTLGSTRDFFDQDRLHLERALDVAWHVRDLTTALGLTPALRALVATSVVTGTPFLDGYARARQVRARLGLGALEIIDPRAVLEDALAVPVVIAALRAPMVAAVTIKDASIGVAAVIINSAAGRHDNRRLVNVDLAHELAHVMFDQAGEDVEAWIDRGGDDPEGSADDRHEQRARAFAAELLLPASGLRELFGGPKQEADVVRAAGMVATASEQLETPAELTSYHLMNHGFIAKAVRAQARALAAPELKQLPASGHEGLLARLVQRALASGAITEARARALLGRSIWD